MRSLVFVWLLAAAAMAQPEKEPEKPKHPFIGDPKAIEAGRALFAAGCAVCHGVNGEGGRGPNLRERVYWHPLEEDTIYKAIQKGIGANMPAANLPEDETWRLVAFVKALTSPAFETPVPGDAKAGEELFWGKAGCGGCHGIRGRGGKLGPDLGEIAAVRPAAHIRESIVDPDADGAVGYRAATIVLTSGKTLKGVARNRTNYSLQLQDAEGSLHLVRIADVREMTLGKGSPMPKDFAQRLSAADIDNLVAFLSRQTAREITRKN